MGRENFQRISPTICRLHMQNDLDVKLDPYCFAVFLLLQSGVVWPVGSTHLLQEHWPQTVSLVPRLPENASATAADHHASSCCVRPAKNTTQLSASGGTLGNDFATWKHKS